MTVIIPSLLSTRWREAHQKPSVMQWAAVSELAATYWANAILDDLSQEYLDDLRTLADVAYMHKTILLQT